MKDLLRVAFLAAATSMGTNAEAADDLYPTGGINSLNCNTANLSAEEIAKVQAGLRKGMMSANTVAYYSEKKPEEAKKITLEALAANIRGAQEKLTTLSGEIDVLLEELATGNIREHEAILDFYRINQEIEILRTQIELIPDSPAFEAFPSNFYSRLVAAATLVEAERDGVYCDFDVIGLKQARVLTNDPQLIGEHAGSTSKSDQNKAMGIYAATKREELDQIRRILDMLSSPSQD